MNYLHLTDKQLIIKYMGKRANDMCRIAEILIYQDEHKMTNSDVAAHFNCSRNSVRDWKNTYNLNELKKNYQTVTDHATGRTETKEIVPQSYINGVKESFKLCKDVTNNTLQLLKLKTDELIRKANEPDKYGEIKTRDYDFLVRVLAITSKYVLNEFGKDEDGQGFDAYAKLKEELSSKQMKEITERIPPYLREAITNPKYNKYQS
jgi:hypothetical protein